MIVIFSWLESVTGIKIITHRSLIFNDLNFYDFVPSDSSHINTMTQPTLWQSFISFYIRIDFEDELIYNQPVIKMYCGLVTHNQLCVPPFLSGILKTYTYRPTYMYGTQLQCMLMLFLALLGCTRVSFTTHPTKWILCKCQYPQVKVQHQAHEGMH